MRCSICDYCPTAPSLFDLAEGKRNVRLVWDDKTKGWNCGGVCSGDNTVNLDELMNPYVDEELVEVETVPVALPVR